MAKVSVKSKVALLLQSNKQTRNSDKYLITKYWQEYHGMNETESERLYNFMKDSVPLETITRARRKIQNTEGKFPANKNVTRARLRKQQEMKEALANNEVAE